MKITKAVTGEYGLVKIWKKDILLNIINNHPDKFRLIEIKKIKTRTNINRGIQILLELYLQLC